jgi:hypothetical protein
MSTAKERRKGLISQTAQVKLLVTIDEKIEDLEIAWAEVTFKTAKSTHSVNTTYCLLNHDYSIDHAYKKTDLHKVGLAKVKHVDVRKIKTVGYAEPRESEKIEKWKTKG